MLKDERHKQAGQHYVLIMDRKLEIPERLKSRVRLLEVKILRTVELTILAIELRLDTDCHELNVEMDEAVESIREKMQ